jgi:hypothetical protein
MSCVNIPLFSDNSRDVAKAVSAARGSVTLSVGCIDVKNDNIASVQQKRAYIYLDVLSSPSILPI